MKKKPINIISFNPSFFPLSNNNHRSKKINNKFKKSSTTQYSSKTNSNQIKVQTPSDTPIGINSINNNIYLNLFNKFSSNTSSLKHNMISPKEIISNRINNNQMNKMRKNLNMNEIPSSSSIKTKNKSTYIEPDLIDSMNFINNKGHINIRLDLKNQIINNNNNNIKINNSNRNISDYNINYGEIAEKMKEKDVKIIKLQNDLLKSQEIINGLNNNINNSFRFNNNKNNKNYCYINLNKSSREKNIFLLTKSSESVDKILKTTFNEYNLNNLGNKKQNKKNQKNSFLKKSGNNNKKRINTSNNTNYNKKNINNNIKINSLLYTENNIKNKKQNNYDYLRLLLPLSNSNNTKPRFNSYSNDRKNQKNKINFNFNNYLNITDKNKKQKLYLNNNNKNNINKENNFLEFVKKCSNIKQRAKNLIDNYIDLANYLTISKKEF